MIDHDRKFIFVANCKTGTTSIVDALGIPGVKMHYPAKKLKLLPHIAPFWKEYYKFGFVRNPWDLLVSWWHYMNHEHRLGTFHNFIKNIDSSPPIGKWSWVSNYDSVSNRRDDIIIDFVGRFESINDDLNTVCDSIGMPRVKLKKKNTTKHRKYTSYYDNICKEIVGTRCWKDVKYFGYRFE